jgi:hypothetical protein
MTDKERIELIRKGNELFNQGKIEEAAKIFLQTNYIDGLIRVGDHYYYQDKKLLKAFVYYKRANYRKRLEEIYEKMARVIKFLLEEDKKQVEAASDNVTSDNVTSSTQENRAPDTNSQSQSNNQVELVKKYEFPRIK